MAIFKVKRQTADGKSTYVTMVEADNRSDAYRLLGINPSINKNWPLASTVSEHLMGATRRAFASYSFWLLLMIFYAWAQSRYADIDSEFLKNHALQQRALAIVARVPADGNVCSDGTLSYSRGAGRCSWHGGDSIQFAILSSIAGMDYEKRAQRSKTRVGFFCIFLIGAAVLFSPRIDAYCRRKIFSAT